MKTIDAATFREQYLSLTDGLDPDGLVIAGRGKPVVRLVPNAWDDAGLIGGLPGKGEIPGDILSTGAEWNADGHSRHRHRGHAVDCGLRPAERELPACSRSRLSASVFRQLAGAGR